MLKNTFKHLLPCIAGSGSSAPILTVCPASFCCCRAADYARNNEARVKKLRQIVQLGVSCRSFVSCPCSLSAAGH
jgi:hypothetical protein